MIDPITFTVGCACIGLSRLLIGLASKRELASFKRARSMKHRRGVGRKANYAVRMTSTSST
jgi:hypothetical protein